MDFLIWYCYNKIYNLKYWIRKRSKRKIYICNIDHNKTVGATKRFHIGYVQ